MSAFLVQVNKDGGYANIQNNSLYENHLWTVKPRDTDHGQVKVGDELFIYCTGNVPKHGRSLAFKVAVEGVSHDHVTFQLGKTDWFPYPLRLPSIRELVAQNSLPNQFSKCGQQGFNIVRIDTHSADQLMSLVTVGSPAAADPEATSTVTAEATVPSQSEKYTVQNIIGEGCFFDLPRLEVMLHRLRTKQNLILQGPPGTGKTWLAKRLAYALIGSKDDSKVRPVQFHPNLSYEDFVRGWRPQGNGQLELVDGPFLQVVEDARSHPNNDYVIVIEEINRGNPASIFGEMLTLLEADKRNPDEALALAYPRKPGERVYIPPNVYVIGTMNLADRSLAMVDLALRRRFAFFDLEPMLNDTWREWVNEQCGIENAFLDGIAQRIDALNEEIAADRNLGRQFRIGHSFVTPPPGTSIEDPDEWFAQVVETEIVPPLHEYWFDDPDRVTAARTGLLGTA